MTRIHSLKKDKNDDTAFRHGRTKHIGTMFNEFYQRIPYFFTRDRMPIELIGQYRGWGAFLICNGPSLSSGNFDLSLLKKPGVMTYGINNGPKTIRPNFWGCVDDPKRFLKSIWLDPCIMKFVPHAHQDKPLFDSEKWEDMKIGNRPLVVGDCPNVVYYHRNEKFNAERFLYEDTINWGNSGEFGGGRSVMIPALRILFLLGFRKIYLLGADFKMSETYTYHFDEQRSKGAVNCNMSTYAKMKDEYFPALKPYFDEEGLQVFNCNPDSELKVFPYKSYDEALNECTAPLGSVENERTWGLYCKAEERGNWKNDPAPQQKAHLQTIAARPSAPISAFTPQTHPVQTQPVQPSRPQQQVRQQQVPQQNPPYEIQQDIPQEELTAEYPAINVKPSRPEVFQSVNQGFETQAINPIDNVQVKVIDPNIENVDEGDGVNWASLAKQRTNNVQQPQQRIPQMPQRPQQPQQHPPQIAQRSPPPNPVQDAQPKPPRKIVNIEDEAERMSHRPQARPIQPTNQTVVNPNFQHQTELVRDNNVATYVKERIVKAIPCGDVQPQRPMKNITIDDNGR